MHNIYPNGDEVSNVDIVYICKNYEGELKCQTGEVENLKFFDISALPYNIFKPNLPAIEEYIVKNMTATKFGKFLLFSKYQFKY